ncbi:MAG: amidohydrolase family protein [Alphaproteobacteria bacterium]
MNETTCIRHIDFLIAADAAGHHYLRDADLAFADGAITFVGRHYDGPVTTEVDGRHMMVMPGMVNIHCHPSSTFELKGIRDELSSPKMFGTVLFEYTGVVSMDDEYRVAGLQASLAELLKSGCTTVVDFEFPFDGWLDTLADSGIRAYAGATFQSASFRTSNGHETRYDWDEESGRQQFRQAIAAVDAAERHESGRLKGMICPGQADSVTEELIRETVAAAADRNMPVQVHAGQSIVEFAEMMRRHGKSPVQWLNDLGFLRPGSILAHCLFTDDNPRLFWPEKRDIGILAETGATIAHCPVVQARAGRVLHSFSSHRKRGVNIGVGIDANPLNMVDEVRNVAQMGCVADGYRGDATVADAFSAATLGGAKALQRDDLGRIAVGARADLVLVDLTHPLMQPRRDPLRTLVFSALERPIRHVYVDGRQVVRDGEVTAFDHGAAAAKMNAGQEQVLARVAQRHWSGGSGDQVFPRALATRQ